LAKEKVEKLNAEKKYLMGKFNPSEREDFSLIPKKYVESLKNNGQIYLREETLFAFLKMQEAAKTDGVNLKIVSGTRNFAYQKDIWNSKWVGAILVDGKNLSKSIPDYKKRFEKILEYSAAPGTSRHHWGTDIDVNDTSVAYFKSTQGDEIYNWLSKNAEKFGFCQPYNEKTLRKNGHNEEPWHWSYKPLSKDFTNKYVELISDEDIRGFFGDTYASSFNLINNYVLSINPECL
jgi:LAS superfamily LD-carboxypeptidase LdcB